VRQYYYTVAALPSLALEEQPFFDRETFLDHCATFLHPRDLEYVRSASIDPDIDWTHLEWTGELARWNEVFRSFMLNGAVARAQRLGWEIEIDRDRADAIVAEHTRQLIGEETPLKTEISFLRRMWAFIDSIELGHFFDRESIALYYLKLQLALRYRRITDEDAGREEFDRQYGELSKALMEIDT
jgi:hypothetical protein